jgi:hypothetical protein
MIYKTLNIINQKIFIIIFIFCIFTACASIYIVQSNQIIFTQIDKLNDIETKSINYDTNKYSITIQYPHTTSKIVNNEITNLINNYIRKTEEDTKYFIPNTDDDIFKLNISCESERINKDIISFIFLIKYSYNNAINEINVKTVSYDLRKGKENSNYVQNLCQKSKEFLTNSETIENRILQFFIDDISFTGSKSFDGYSFSAKYLSIYFSTNKISSEYNIIYEVKIPWKDVSSLLKSNVYLLE